MDQPPRWLCSCHFSYMCVSQVCQQCVSVSVCCWKHTHFECTVYFAKFVCARLSCVTFCAGAIPQTMTSPRHSVALAIALVVAWTTAATCLASMPSSDSSRGGGGGGSNTHPLAAYYSQLRHAGIVSSSSSSSRAALVGSAGPQLVLPPVQQYTNQSVDHYNPSAGTFSQVRRVDVCLHPPNNHNNK